MIWWINDALLSCPRGQAYTWKERKEKKLGMTKNMKRNYIIVRMAAFQAKHPSDWDTLLTPCLYVKNVFFEIKQIVALILNTLWNYCQWIKFCMDKILQGPWTKWTEWTKWTKWTKWTLTTQSTVSTPSTSSTVSTSSTLSTNSSATRKQSYRLESNFFAEGLDDLDF